MHTSISIDKMRSAICETFAGVEVQLYYTTYNYTILQLYYTTTPLYYNSIILQLYYTTTILYKKCTTFAEFEVPLAARTVV